MSIIGSLWGVVLTASLYATIVGLSIIGIQRLLKKKLSPKWNYLIWLILIIKLIIPFGPKSEISIFNQLDFSGINKIYYDESVSQNTDISQNLNNTYENEIDKNRYNDINKNNKIDNYEKDSINFIPIIWIGICINMFIFIVITFTVLNINLKRKSIKSNNKIYLILIKAKEKIKVRRNIKVVISPYISTPSLTGVIIPKILIPENMVDLQEKELEYIFLHELSHYKRKDIVMNYILIILQCIHWFNPFVWWFFKKVKEDMEFATDEKVLHILEDEEHKEYGLALLTVLSKINNSMFYPRLVSMANDKKRVEKRIKNIKYMDYIKKKKFIFSTIGIAVLIVLVPIMLTSKLNKITNLQSGYLKISRLIENEKTVSDDVLKNIFKKLSYRQTDGKSLGLDNTHITSIGCDAIEYTNDNEIVLLVYDKNLGIETGIREVYYGSNFNTNISDIYLKYSNPPNKEYRRYGSQIGVLNYETQNKVMSILDEDFVESELYKNYIKTAKQLDGNILISKNDVLKINNNISEFEVSNDKNFSDEGLRYEKESVGMSININTKLDSVYSVVLSDGEKSLSLRSDLPIYTSSVLDINKVGVIRSSYDSIDTHEKLITGIMNENLKETRKTKLEFDNDVLAKLHEKDNSVGMISRDDISYSSEVNPKELSMEKSIEYVKENTNQNIKEISRKYEDEVGVTEVKYESENKKYVVRYMHPYIEEGYITYQEYDLSKTVGIWIYESAFNIG